MLQPLSRRLFSQLAATLPLTAVATTEVARATPRCDDAAVSTRPIRAGFQFNYLLASSLYGYLYLGEILPEVKATGATAIDLWPKVHGNQREQLDDLGEEKFLQLLAQHQIALGCLTQYKLGPFGLQSEMRVAQRCGCQTIVTGATGPSGLEGAELKRAVQQFVEQMKPHLETAEETNVTIAIENHGRSLIESPDSIRWLAEFAPNKLGIALAPYHLPQVAQELAQLIRDIGSRMTVFYAWQHGQGSMQRQPKPQELEQLPGRGSLDFGPLVQALAEINYTGWTEIFMHPYPRGTSMLESTSLIREELNAAQNYLTACIPATPAAS